MDMAETESAYPETVVVPEQPGEDYPVKLFGEWECADAAVDDLGLRRYINTDNMLAPRSRGRHGDTPFHKADVHIVERLMNALHVAGHKGKKHKLTSGHNVGRSQTVFNIIKDTFHRIEDETGENPVHVLADAVENGAPKEEVVTYQRGGIMARKAVVVAPQRRVDLALRHIAQGAYQSREGRKADEALAEEIINAAEDSRDSYAAREKQRREREAQGAR
jgi:small subunit ribosomal protein S7